MTETQKRRKWVKWLVVLIGGGVYVAILDDAPTFQKDIAWVVAVSVGIYFGVMTQREESR